ncbi:MAG: hypothetical protein PHO32_02445, partial [Candidatus Cloacimonetes bacterium]|nr:hypothetical protein [Candidatus Cloacimonadota bacterium]
MLRYCYLLLLFGLLAGALSAQTDEGIELPMPQFSNPFYDSFGKNFTGTAASGRGYTGAAVLGDVSGVYLNPAVVLPDSAKLTIELNIKPPVDAEGYTYMARYSSPVPFGMLGITGKLSKNIGAGIVYGMPKSIKLDDFSVLINQGNDIVQRFPSYNLHQLSANLSYHYSSWHMGVNLHNQMHYTFDPIFLRSYDRIRDYQYSFRIQPGIVFSTKKVNLGVSMMPASKFDWDLKYHTYKAGLPLWATAGLNLHSEKFSLSLDAEYEQHSAISDDYKDGVTLKSGIEYKYGKLTYRMGYVYIPEVFSGIIKLPFDTTATADTSIFWDDVASTVTIPQNAQNLIS